MDNVDYVDNAKIIATNKYFRQIAINSIDKLTRVLKTNEIYKLGFTTDPNIFDNDINYKKIFELLKTNTTITHIVFGSSRNINYDYSKWYLLLSDTLVNNNKINSFCLIKSTIDHEEINHINEILRINNNIDIIEIDCRNMNNGVCLGKMLQENKTLNYFYMYVERIITDYEHIIRGLKDNYSITRVLILCRTVLDLDNVINKFCKRNRHNIRLKSMIIQDLN
jgi:hypothetical protein